MELNIVVAHWQEAKPLIERLQLKREGEFWRREGVWLGISGVGVARGALGSYRLLSHHLSPILNIGVAGSDRHPVGKGFWVGKVEAGEGGNCYFPGRVGRPVEVLRTLLTPGRYYRLVDLEGAGFFEGAIAHLSSHWIGLFKVVSDTPTEQFNPSQVPELVGRYWEVVEESWEWWKRDWGEFLEWKRLQREGEEWVRRYRERIHLTFSQQVQLKQLVIGGLLWGVPLPPPPAKPLSKREGKEFLERIELQLRCQIEVGPSPFAPISPAQRENLEEPRGKGVGVKSKFREK